MATYSATITWDRKDEPFLDKKYQRSHEWKFDGGTNVAASSSPHHVPTPYSNSSNVDPEEAFIASISSCHMLFFLSISADRGFVINSYQDYVTGRMGTNKSGQSFITEVILRPAVTFLRDTLPSAKDVDSMHKKAHQKCYIANSVKTTIKIESSFIADE